MLFSYMDKSSRRMQKVVKNQPLILYNKSFIFTVGMSFGCNVMTPIPSCRDVKLFIAINCAFEFSIFSIQVF
jgi:hypothetical protein